jgi:hypothetical protein
VFRLDKVALEAELQLAREELLLAENRLAQALFFNPDLSNRDDEEIRRLQSELDGLRERLRDGDLSFEEYSRRSSDIRVRLINLGAYARDLREIESGIHAARRHVTRLQAAASNADVESPIGGVVDYLGLYPGRSVSIRERLATVYSFDPAIARVNLTEGDVMRVEPGQRARVQLGVRRADTVDAEVDRVHASRSAGGGFAVDISFRPGQVRVLAGMFTEADIAVEVLEDRILVPVDALLRENERHYVFVIDDGISWWRWVTVGRRSGDYVEVEPDPFESVAEAERINGVDPGELVAVEGHTLLSHKARVTIPSSEE